MSFNLLRNSRIFFTTSLDADGTVNTAGISATNTFEIQALDGFGFSQASSMDTVTLNEAGATPTRGQRSYNTTLNPVDFNFTTYIRPFNDGVDVTAEEKYLWNAFFAVDAIGGTNPAWTDADPATCVATNSATHQLQKFGMIVIMDNKAFLIGGAVLNQATIDFGIDAIATIAWTGQGTKLEIVAAPTSVSEVSDGSNVVISGTGWGTAAVGKNTQAAYLANKLSTATITAGINGTGTAYPIALTGGSLTLDNGITFLTPANLGQVNEPITYFTGTRAVTGQVSAYLRTGSSTSKSGELLTNLLANIATDDDPYQVVINMGGTSGTYVKLTMPAAVLAVPDISADQVISTTINFTAQGSNGTAFDIGSNNEISIAYYAA